MKRYQHNCFLQKLRENRIDHREERRALLVQLQLRDEGHLEILQRHFVSILVIFPHVTRKL